jgi:hypothetical protein
MSSGFESEASAGFSSPLWPYVDGVRRLPALLLVLGGVPLATRWMAHANSVWMLATWGLCIFSALVGSEYQRRNRRSLKANFLMFQLCGWPLGITFASFMWNVSYLTGTHSFYARFGGQIAVIFAAMLAGLSLFYVRYWRDGRELFETLGSHRAQGSISAGELYGLLTFQGRSTRMLSVLPVAVGIAVPVSGILAHALGRNIWEFCLFTFLTLILSPYIIAVLIARRWLQKRYLGSDDLIIDG